MPGRSIQKMSPYPFLLQDFSTKINVEIKSNYRKPFLLLTTESLVWTCSTGKRSSEEGGFVKENTASRIEKTKNWNKPTTL